MRRGARPSKVPADLSTRAGALEVADIASGIDILVNNAGLQHVSPIETFDPDRWDLILAVMLTAPFLLIRGIVPGMYERGFGRIVNISSVHGLVASPFKSAYVSAKHRPHRLDAKQLHWKQRTGRLTSPATPYAPRTCGRRSSRASLRTRPVYTVSASRKYSTRCC